MVGPLLGIDQSDEFVKYLFAGWISHLLHNLYTTH